MATATATETKLENPKNSSDVNPNTPATEDELSNQTLASSGGGGDESKSEPAAVRTGDTHDGGAVTDIDKKMKRAERFGMPVQMTEEEKRNSRAERFGIGQSDPSDEEAKKKARLARFGSISKTDSVEEDKKKARAISLQSSTMAHS
ncbi:hypothetical protein DH2020_040160 [Rehmannia glutinosa]|uniref:THO1-MOS11 C-terminal domain-containing protein n=1 Tax=Rehmannia glutinosa TaxID=99300 RepID=A0ABR0UUT1_REHGL